MKLHIKLVLYLLSGVLAVLIGAQCVQQILSARLMKRLSAKNVALLEECEWNNANNLQQTSEQVVRDSMARGEMDRLADTLQVHRNTKAVLEYSLFNDKGVAIFSSSPAFLQKSLPSDIKSQLLSKPEKISRRSTEAFEIYQPMLVEKKCVECHDDKKIGSIGAVTLFRFSADGLAKANQNWLASFADIRSLNLRSVWVTTLIVTIMFVILAYYVVRSLVAVPLSRLINDLTSGAVQVNQAASQISASSQSLAEGASEQAASLEETSASLEEMSSMTRKNAENAESAKALATGTRQAADIGAADMQAMSDAMNAIKISSDGISKIIKTIDEIAFQTNILALNAAVEAARAGEAGMGFAVVADEVRNLAQRSAESARETAAKIEDSIQKSESGVQISAKVAQNLQEIVGKVRKVDGLVAEIATASKEQSIGIEQVNTAVSQMDKVTQSNAASAEESASASEELNEQAGALRNAVMELQRLVGGASRLAASTGTDDKTGRNVDIEHGAKTQPARVKGQATHRAEALEPVGDARHTAYDTNNF
jgi:hypothetical protein